jgi:hypothetical protein
MFVLVSLKKLSHFIAACPTLICRCFLLQIFKTAVTYFGARWRLWRQWHCCVSLFTYYYEVKSRDWTTNIRTLAHSTYIANRTQWFPPPRCRVTKTRHLPEQNVTSNWFHMCTIYTQRWTLVSARPFCPVSFAPLNTCMTYAMTLLRAQRMHTTVISLCCRPT